MLQRSCGSVRLLSFVGPILRYFHESKCSDGPRTIKIEGLIDQHVALVSGLGDLLCLAGPASVKAGEFRWYSPTLRFSNCPCPPPLWWPTPEIL